jgi:hypothetical protein
MEVVWLSDYFCSVSVLSNEISKLQKSEIDTVVSRESWLHENVKKCNCGHNYVRFMQPTTCHSVQFFFVRSIVYRL